MSSVQDRIDCPSCGLKATYDLNCKTFEEEIYCQHCGYSSSLSLKRDANDEPIRNKNGSYQYVFDEIEGRKL